MSVIKKADFIAALLNDPSINDAKSFRPKNGSLTNERSMMHVMQLQSGS